MAVADSEMALIKVEYPAARIGMASGYSDYLSGLRKRADARSGATPEQQAAEIRYYLLGYWIRNYGTGAEALRSASGSSITRGKGDGLAGLRAEQFAQRVLAGLPDPRAGTIRGGSSPNLPVF